MTETVDSYHIQGRHHPRCRDVFLLWWHNLFFLFFFLTFQNNLLFKFFVVVLDLHCCAGFLQLRWAGPTVPSGLGLLTAVGSFVAEQTLGTQAPVDTARELSSVANKLSCSAVWDLSRPGIEPMSPALAGRFFTTEPPAKSNSIVLSLLRETLFEIPPFQTIIYLRLFLLITKGGLGESSWSCLHQQWPTIQLPRRRAHVDHHWIFWYCHHLLV